jgi:hypothetical protein
VRTLRIVERRTMRLPGGRRVPRTLDTIVRYPTAGPASRHDVPGATPLHGPFPLIVFGHGFAVTPAPYAALLRAWAMAGFVVAAPLFPGTASGARGGPNPADVYNQPGDMSAVITRLIRMSRTPGIPFHGLVDAGAIAVAGQSDGGVTALAAAYSRRDRDPRVRAAIVLSGAEFSGFGGFPFAAGEPALLATQGTADTTNLPKYTDQYFAAAASPKFLLRLLGAGHLPPYTTEQPQLGIVERVTVAFLRRYLEATSGAGAAPALSRLRRAGNVPGRAALTADP